MIKPIITFILLFIIIYAGLTYYPKLTSNSFTAKKLTGTSQRSKRPQNEAPKPWLSLNYEALREEADRRVIEMLQNSNRGRPLLRSLRKMLNISCIRIRNEPLRMYQVALITLVVFSSVTLTANHLLNNMTAGLLCGFFVIAVLYQLLRIEYSINMTIIKKSIPYFLLMLSNYFAVYKDPILAIDHVVDKAPKPLRKDLLWFVNSIKFGNSVEHSLSVVKERMPTRLLKDLLDDIYFYINYGGDFQESVIGLLNRYYDRYTLEMGKLTEAFGTVLVFGVLVATYIIMIFVMSANQPGSLALFTTTKLGRTLVVVKIIIFLIAGYFAKSAITIEEDE